MAIVTTEMLAAAMAHKADFSARSLTLDDLLAAELASPSDPVELPAVYDIDDVVNALVALGLVTITGSGS